jgi:hypothetical protein
VVEGVVASAQGGRKELPAWLGPVVGAISTGTAALLVGIYAYGMSVPAEHEVSRRIEVDNPPEHVRELLFTFERRAEWRPHVVRVVKVDDVGGMPSWREFAEDGDRFQFVVREVGQDRLVLGMAKPEDHGFDAVWTWQLEPLPDGGTAVTLTERGRVDNPMFRGLWALREGPYAAVDLDLQGLGEALDRQRQPEGQGGG